MQFHAVPCSSMQFHAVPESQSRRVGAGRLQPPVTHTHEQRSRRRIRRARFGRDAIRQGRQRPRRVGHVLLRVGESSRPCAARWRHRQRLSDRRAQTGVGVAPRRSVGARAGRRCVISMARAIPSRPSTRPKDFDHTRRLLELSSGKFQEQFRSAPFVFLGNIDPRLQLDVLTQVAKPKLVACDTMNFWIESRRPDLLKLLERVDLITLNDAEARQLTEEFNLIKAARWIMARGPKVVVIKKGEHGAFMFTEGSIFFAPAYPLESVFDPTGAGDSFAGGFMGYLARTGDIVRGESSPSRDSRFCCMGSFAVEQFSVDAAPRDYAAGHRAPRGGFLPTHQLRAGHRVSNPLDYRTAGVDIDVADAAKAADQGARALDDDRRRSRGVRRLRRHVSRADRCAEAGARVERRRRRNEGEGRDRGRASRHGGPRPREPLRERHSRARRDAAVFHGLCRVWRAGRGRRRECRRRGCRRLPREWMRASRR